MRKYTGFCQTTRFRCLVNGERRNSTDSSSFLIQFCHRYYYSTYFKTLNKFFRTNFDLLLFRSSTPHVVIGCQKSKRFVLHLTKYDLFYHNRRTVDKILPSSSSSTLTTRRFFSSSSTSPLSPSTLINYSLLFGRSFGGGLLLNGAKRNNYCYYSGLLNTIGDKRHFGDWILTSSSRVPDQNNNSTTTVQRKDSYEVRDEQETMEYFENNSEKPVFQPKRVVILTKLTRLEFERRTNPDLSEDELAKCLKLRGSDYNTLLEKFRMHVSYLNTICKELENKGIEYRLLQRWDYTEENIEWADAIFTAGGDGTFLLAASKIRDRNKPVIGINTDPNGSEGYMCLMKKSFLESQFPSALERLLNGDFNWLWRQRIRVTLSGKDSFDDPIELHDQQLMYPEYRWTEHVRENEDVRFRSKSRLKAKSSIGADTPDSNSPVMPSFLDGLTTNGPRRNLPYLALNEVFVGESLSSRVSYYELQVDENERIKQKSSGLSVCTGTGSTSWYFNINKLTDRCVRDLMQIMNEELAANLPTDDQATISRLCKRFNEQLIFSPSDLRMAYTVRDPVFNATFPPCPPRGFAQKVVIKSRCFDAHLVIDGGMSYIFNDGSQAMLEMHPEDALRTVIFR